MSDYKTIRGVSTFTYEEKRSRFIATAAFADTEEKALAVLNGVRAATARRGIMSMPMCCRTGAPAIPTTGNRQDCGHAGAGSHRHAELSDVIVVVTRYFGGILLGTGGLVRAYTTAASGALQQAELVSMRLVVDCSLQVPYGLFEQAQRMIAASGARLQEPVFADAVTLLWRMPSGEETSLCASLAELTRGAAQVEVSAPAYAPF